MKVAMKFTLKVDVSFIRNAMRCSQAKDVLFFNGLGFYSNLTVIKSFLKMLHQCNIWCTEGIGNKPSDSEGS